jgi:Tfp pilus assembly protein PilF
MSALQRALLLIDTSRPQLAEREVRGVLAAEPDNDLAHLVLAHALIAQGNPADAEAEAREAIRLVPDYATAYAVLAETLELQHRFGEAEDAARVAVAGEPESATDRALLARILLNSGRPAEALLEVENALALDPGEESAATLRALAMARLGRPGDARAAIDEALARSPESNPSHVISGWLSLAGNRPDDALASFYEGLRLDPGDDLARFGLVEALKAQHALYALLLRFAFWAGRLDVRWRSLLTVGPWLFVVFGHLLFGEPMWLVPFALVYGAFVVLIWLSEPAFNLTLMLRREGRLALSDEQLRATRLFAATLLLAAALALGALATEQYGSLLGTVGVVFAAISLGTSHLDAPRTRRIRQFAAAVACALGVVGFMLCVTLGVKDAAYVLAFAFGAGTMGMWLDRLETARAS